VPLSVERTLRKAERLVKQGETALAVQEYQRVLQAYPNNRPAQQGLKALQKPIPEMGVAGAGPGQQLVESLMSLFNQGRLQETLTQGEALLAQFPDTPFLLNLLGATSMAMGRAADADAHFEKALQLKPDYAVAYRNRAKALSVLARHDEAVTCYQQLLQLRPGDANAHNDFGNTLSILGRHDEAKDRYREALALQPDFVEAHRNLSEATVYRSGDEHIEQMLQLIDRPGYGDKERFTYFKAGNRVIKARTNYDIAADRAAFASLKSSFASDAGVLPTTSDDQEEGGRQPVFIVGMPRSGTTLVEQILASHSQVFGAGELGLLGQAVAEAEKESADDVEQQIAAVREAYLSGIAKLDGAQQFVTDKMPSNFLWIGFIVAALPEAKIVHVTRDARATCWSNYRNLFSAGGSNYSRDLEDVAHYYNLYRDLMAFWHEQYPEKICDLDYEALTNQQEEQTRLLLDYVGLGWEDQCLEFYKSRRAVKTASAAQVRQKMYQGSSEAWRNYEEHLRPMLQILGA
jgi:tetratricopeptide (TPR) repeat protein